MSLVQEKGKVCLPWKSHPDAQHNSWVMSSAAYLSKWSSHRWSLWNETLHVTSHALVPLQIHNVNTLNETYPPMPMMNFILTCVWIGHLWNSVNKRREPSQSKQSLRGFLWKPFPSSSATDVPPFYYFIDRQSLRPAYKGFSCSVTALSDQSAPPTLGSQSAAA